MKNKITFIEIAMLLIAFYALPINSLAQAGSLDLSFDTDGKIVTHIGTSTDIAESQALQTDGKILVAGSSKNGSANTQFSLVRYNTNGSLDNTFDFDGKVTTKIGTKDYGNSVGIQSDGKIVVAGYSFNGFKTDFALVRYNTDGSLDYNFDFDARVTTAFGTSFDEANAITIQNDGKIIVVGSSMNGLGNHDFALARYNTLGGLDNTFDFDGKVTTPIGTNNDIGYAVGLQSDGKIIVAGVSMNSSSNLDFTLVRYKTNGSLDTTFDNDGKVTTPIGAANDYAYSINIQSDGKIVLTGSSNNGSNDDFAIVRYNLNGSLDNTFDFDGKVTTQIGLSNEVGRSAAIQSDGKIVASGWTNSGSNNDFALARYNTNGSLDNTFDSDGKVTLAVGNSNDEASSVKIQTDGKIVVVGESKNSYNTDFAALRLNTNGSLDNSFNADGKVTTTIGISDDFGSSIALQSNGKILVGGISFNSSDGDFALVRYNTNGSLDTSFDHDGKVTTDIGIFSEETGSFIAIQNDDKILLAGTFGNGVNNNDFALVRYNSNGSLDSSFDFDGKATTSIGISNDEVQSIAIQSNGKIVLAGFSNNGSTIDFALARYNSNGSLDNTFDFDGKVTTPIGSSSSLGLSVAIQSDGKILVTGYSYFGFNSQITLVRYLTNGSLDSTFDSDGIVTTAIGISNDYGNSVAIQNDGKIVVAGGSDNGSNTIFALVRYNTNGSLDTTFDNDGIVTTAIGTLNSGANSVNIQLDGMIIVAGSSNNGSIAINNFALTRYQSNGSLDNSFDSDGIVTTALGGFSTNGYASFIQTDGKILLVGANSNDTNSNFALARYNNSNNVGVIEIDKQILEMDIYPNPFSTYTTLKSSNIFNEANFIIYNIYGQQVKQSSKFSGKDYNLSRENLHSGMYFIQVTQENKIILSSKLIITD